MRIINGKWQDDNGGTVSELNYHKLKKIGENLSTLYGKNITYSRIELLTSITSLSSKQEEGLINVLNQKEGISKLAGF